MRIAYADPPYPGNGHRYPEKKEVNHRLLIAHLQEFDGWALSTGSTNLAEVLPMCPPKTRVGAWVKTMNFMPWAALPYLWEPVLFQRARGNHRSYPNLVWDWCKCAPRTEFFLGAKPDDFCFWLFGILGAHPDDEFVDLFPGSNAVTRAWEAWRRQIPLPLGV